jgi:dienelactone hydrolase
MKLLIALLIAAVSASTPALWSGLRPGPHQAGTATTRAGELTVTFWYPAASAGRAITLSHFTSSAAAFAEEAGVDGLPPDVIGRYAAHPMFATADAPPLERQFPLVLVAQGNQQRPLHQAVLAEFLASHGFIVATVESSTITHPMKTADDVGAAAQREAERLAIVLDIALARPEVDDRRIAMVGHSFGARAALLLAMHDRRIKALASLDGGIGTAQAIDSFKRAKWFAPDHPSIPLLHFYETADAFMAPDFTLLRSLPSRNLSLRRADPLHHVHFTTLGFGAAADAALGRVVGFEKNGAAGLRMLAGGLLRFLDQSDQPPSLARIVATASPLRIVAFVEPESLK